MSLYTERDAELSPDGTNRYSLVRQWHPGRRMVIIGLNPSTADAQLDDQTVLKCVGFARRHGFGSIWIANLFSYRSPSPAELRAMLTLSPLQAIGPHWAKWMLTALHMGKPENVVVAAWGSTGVRWPEHQRQVAHLTRLAQSVNVTIHCFGTTKTGAPRHLSRLAYSTPLERWWSPPPSTIRWLNSLPSTLFPGASP